jgi:hypothetical protein
MHLVFATPVLPAASPDSISGMAGRTIVDGLQRAGVRVTRLGYSRPGASSPGDDAVSLGEIGGIDELSLRPDTLLTAMSRGMPLSSAALRIAPETELRAALEALGPSDGIVLDGVALAGAYPLLAKKPFMLLPGDVGERPFFGEENAVPAFLRRLLVAREAKALDALERKLAADARYVLTPSGEDGKRLGLDADRSGILLPAGAPPEPSGLRLPAFDVGMLGDWTHPRMRAGLEWFLTEIVPLLRPQVSVAVAGKMPRGLARRSRRVLFLGPVMDNDEFLRQCRIVALTARAREGLYPATLRVCELGLPAVATPQALRAIPDLPGSIVRADEPKAFAAALHDLVVSQRTESLTAADGATFHAERQARADRVIADALARFSG